MHPLIPLCLSTLPSALGFIPLPISISSRYTASSKLHSSRSSRDKMVDRAIDLMQFRRVSSEETPVLLTEEPMLPALETAVLAADDRKAGYVYGMRVSGQSEIATFMLIVEGNSRPQIQAIGAVANAVEDRLLAEFSIAASKEGTAGSGWIVLDYGSMIVHVMTPQMRSFYKIERRWRDAEEIDLAYLLEGRISSAQDEDAVKGEDEVRSDGLGDEDDPFWS